MGGGDAPRRGGKGLIGKMVLISTGLGALYWFLDVVLDSAVLHHSTFLESLIRPDAMCLAMRLGNWVLLTGFAVYAQMMLLKRRQAEEVLKQERDRAQLYLSEFTKAGKEREALIIELREALEEVKTLGSLLPICSHCKKIRDDKGYWHQVEVYIGNRVGTTFSHGICPACMSKHYPGLSSCAGDGQGDTTQ